MSILTFATNDTFVIRIHKHHVNNVERTWANSYEVLANSSGALSDLDGLIQSIVLFEKLLHLGNIQFDRGTASTWEEDSTPYNPSTFYVRDLDGFGTRGGSSPYAPITTCLNVVRAPTSGRQGHIFYRGVLSQADLVVPSGIAVLEDPDAWSGDIDTALITSELGVYIGSLATGPLQLCMINRTGTNVRPVMELKVGGVSELPTDHAWFNRTPAP